MEIEIVYPWVVMSLIADTCLDNHLYDRLGDSVFHVASCSLNFMMITMCASTNLTCLSSLVTTMSQQDMSARFVYRQDEIAWPICAVAVWVLRCSSDRGLPENIV